MIEFYVQKIPVTNVVHVFEGRSDLLPPTA